VGTRNYVRKGLQAQASGRPGSTKPVFEMFPKAMKSWALQPSGLGETSLIMRTPMIGLFLNRHPFTMKKSGLPKIVRCHIGNKNHETLLLQN